MRFMILVKASKESEAGMMPGEQMLTKMGKFNEELAKAGVLLAGEGLHPSSKGTRVKFSGDQRIVTDGPFAESKEFIAGFWIIDVKDADEAYRFAAKISMCPGPGGKPLHMPLEVRQVGSAPA